MNYFDRGWAKKEEPYYFDIQVVLHTWVLELNTVDRLNRIRSHCKECSDCGFIYLPMSGYTKKHCPECSDITEDEYYLAQEEKELEIVNSDELYNDPLI